MSDTFIIKKPWITEQSTDLSKIGQYVFIVQKNATKPEVKKAIHEIYKVDVTAVNIVNRPAKQKRMGQRYGTQQGYKKAIVTLKKGQKIDLT
ncbi:MAG: 50S ribosomal protein L23 [Candidatus Liptonbacteria bacterium RIFCSPLOWO2_01_FULL_52_25]|uniref:Large ribosomal subunit protein uL23 n=1 Tax=Candidatus Liptonbacteria bacterium RIFCSPLOWO2_01_FULL_52_25 TaxID=1798650 RepID=A0A1G2CFS1_9BACT|nr:MAG: 50S ribosomal protein L23 [Candidatus Liptonbacteria bacterium RIFCSPLOWO2_01_FULL_52_25]